MPRYKLTIEYDGTPFAGWQVQAIGSTVQGVLTDAVEASAGETRAGAGRRAAPMPACMRAVRSRMSISPRSGTPTRCAMRSTRICGRIPSRCLSAERAADDFDARISAVKRHYLYRIINRRARSRARSGRAWRVPRPLDAAAMHAAAQHLVGKHDFTTFRSTECQAKSPVKTLDRLDVERDEGHRAHCGFGALFPAQSGALDGRLAGAGRRGQMEAGRSRARACRTRPHGLRARRATRRALSHAGGLLSFGLPCARAVPALYLLNSLRAASHTGAKP